MPQSPLIGIVDDDPDIPAALASLFRSLGYRAECFSSAEEILATISLKKFACVISDIHMPSMSGLELVPELHRRERDLPVILMTGRLETGLREKALSCGATAFVVKPFSFEELVETIKRTVEC
ncbi:response regulator transcription factor [Rhizobium mesoamericanum]|uniref:response regulator transcription factor n=1 Tax=Rhizobium mesoamericanum TaxID=1079800 RepID=UPI000491DCC6|nr:response regulator [Rhizobium mesoamericanum]